ncbi:MAG: ATP-binding protein [Gammaproteobacteria bacterium]|nr:ATP-binding protein [Gammaproteobacteria bacterium]
MPGPQTNDTRGPESARDDYQRALLNILEDLQRESEWLWKVDKAMLNMFEDAAEEEKELEAMQRASFNILEDVAHEARSTELAHRAVLNILEDTAANERELELTQRALINVLEDVATERAATQVTNTALAHEIAERARVEEQLRHTNLRLVSILESSLDPMLTIGPNGLVAQVNSITEVFTGKSQGELVGSPVDQIFTDPEKAHKAFAIAFADGYVRDVRLELRRADGKVTPVLFNAAVYRDELGEVAGVFAAARDISALQLAEDELRSLNRQLEQALAELRATQQQVVQAEKLSAIGTMAAGVAHELNNPMMGVINYLANARRVVKEPEVARRLERADRELQRMRALLHGLLAFARPITEEAKETDVVAILERALELVEPDLKVREIRLIRHFDVDLPKVVTKENHLQQAFINLLLNARDALEHAEDRTLCVSAHEAGGWVRIEVADSGPGIPPELQQRIFDPFFTTRPPGKGTGLGLSITRIIVQDVGGRLSLKSAPGKGARFTVALPERGVKEANGLDY